eukprot:CAMPEP_0197571766 /NCGR_PEP_ID=MMETSP1320-20131121/42121_1 /TAXON_ID=91990 /ORGANISM="Bolidomonas sp., Strain RCC2347" /LENGTH=272 /DNA_ID=CAMNT_0043134263 /DNA_START=1561 /DNA_END=2376 /DNA_ORIENTATION=-
MVFEVGVEATATYLPAPHVVAEVHPTAPFAENFPASQSVHSEAPPKEYFPAPQGSMESRSSVGFCPAGAVLQVLLKASSEYCPGPLQSVHTAVFPPIDALPAGQATALSLDGEGAVRDLISTNSAAGAIGAARSALSARLTLVTGLAVVGSADVKGPSRASGETGAVNVGNVSGRRSLTKGQFSSVRVLPGAVTFGARACVAAHRHFAFHATSHTVSLVIVQWTVLYRPAGQVAQLEHPAAPSGLVSPSPQGSQVSEPPTEEVPEGHTSRPV